jgi:GTPase Era involved in 16S rRNA processing
MNKLVGDRLSIATSKAQTTRHRIMGVVTGEDYQLIYSDTPGIFEPKYAMHSEMMAVRVPVDTQNGPPHLYDMINVQPRA